MTETRRHALKMLGAISASCAFPFAADELYGQHSPSPAPVAPAAAPASTPAFFTADEYLAVQRVADLIIPPTDTPGAVAAGVPEYIDLVVSNNAEHQALARAGLAWLEREAQARFSVSFAALPDEPAIALLQPLSDAVDRANVEARQARFRTDASGRLVYYVPANDRTVTAREPAQTVDAAALATQARQADMPVRFFRLIKSLTADGYYTSRIGLLDELGYTGNSALAAFPSCIPEA